MKYRLISIPLVTALLGVTAACGDSGTESSPCEIHRLDLALRDGKIPSDTSMRHAASTLFALSGYGELTESSLGEYAGRESISFHYAAMDSAFSSVRAEEKALGRMFGRMAVEFPDVPAARVYAVVSPFNQSVFTAGSTVYVGLNHYLGEDYAPYAYFPDYIRSRKVRARIPLDVAEALVRAHYPYRPEGSGTALSAITYEGLVAEAVMRVCHTGEAMALGLDKAQEEWLDRNEGRVWDTLVSRKLLFSSDPSVARALVMPSPATGILDPQAPGAAGRFVGHRIVRALLKADPSATPASLLDSRFYADPSLLTKAGYNPLR